ncbi:MAG: glutathione S-transferase [Gammaproteobacteria bacterium]|jgi:glutathione S-transferase
MMKLYTTDASPFGARVRIQIYKKQLPIKIAPPPGGMGSAELLDISPTGRIPVLDLGHSRIVESEVIQEFLEDTFPEPTLRGDSAETAATIRMLSRITDIYLVPALQPFRSHLKGEDKSSGNLDKGIKDLQQIFALFEHYMTGEVYAVANTLSLADCAMAPMFFYVRFFAQKLDADLSLSNFRRLSTWLEKISSDTAVASVLKEIEGAS